VARRLSVVVYRCVSEGSRADAERDWRVEVEVFTVVDTVGVARGVVVKDAMMGRYLNRGGFRNRL